LVPGCRVWPFYTLGPSSIAGIIEIGWARESHPFDHQGKLVRMADEEYDQFYKSFNPIKFDAERTLPGILLWKGFNDWDYLEKTKYIYAKQWRHKIGFWRCPKIIDYELKMYTI
jgi:hypothetical protein